MKTLTKLMVSLALIGALTFIVVGAAYATPVSQQGNPWRFYNLDGTLGDTVPKDLVKACKSSIALQAYYKKNIKHLKALGRPTIVDEQLYARTIRKNKTHCGFMSIPKLYIQKWSKNKKVPGYGRLYGMRDGQ